MKNNKLEDSLNKLFSNSGYKMVDVSEKNTTHRKALATGEIVLSAEIIKLIKNKKMPKGDPLSIAEVSGINGVKKTSELIPLCHPLSLTHINIDLSIDEKKCMVHCECRAEAEGKTGVEMEALTSVQITLLTIYDMCKAVDRGMSISDIKLLKKTGGKSGEWTRD